MAAGESILWGPWVDYYQLGTGGASYTAGGTIAGSALATYEANMGKQASLVHLTGGWGTNSTSVGKAWSTYQSRCETLISAGRMVLLEWSPWGYPDNRNVGTYEMRPTNINTGYWDSYITQFATDLKAYGKPVLIRMLHEMNLTSLPAPWQHGTSGSYTWAANTWGTHPQFTTTTNDTKLAWQRIVGIFNTVGARRRYGGNVDFVWCPNVRSTGDAVTMAQMYPGNDANSIPYVDWIGVDGYGYRPEMTLRDTLRGGTGSWGGGTGLADSYADLCALDATLPLMICECGINGVGTNSTLTSITSITANGSTWSIVVPGQPPNANWAANNGVVITTANPSGYNGSYPIASVSGSGPYTLVVNNMATPGAFVSGSCQMVNRVARAAALTTSLETDLPAMPRIKGLTWFWTAYSADKWTTDWDGSQPNNYDNLALKAALGNAHYLAGNQMGTSLATRAWVPFQDQVMDSTHGQERLLAVLKSIPGLTGLWTFTESAGPFLDKSGKNHSANITGALSLQAANVVAAESSWGSAQFPGTIGNYASAGDSDDFSISGTGTTGKLSVVLGYVATSSLPSGRVYFANKGSGAAWEWDVCAETANYLSFLRRTAAGGTFVQFGATPSPATDVPHLVVLTCNDSLTNPGTVSVDGGTPVASGAKSGTAGPNGAAALVLGQRSDATAGSQLPSGWRIGLLAIYNTILTAESAADIAAVWLAGPTISSLAAA